VVRINDRGPAAKTGRSLDLAQARAIGLQSVGIAYGRALNSSVQNRKRAASSEHASLLLGETGP
jgi:rare lipoprotein A (peptidoglycan hydrolase)